jgi:hypothetical protein
MDGVRLTYTPRHDATFEAELDVLAVLYQFVLDCHAKQNPAAGQGERGDYDGTEAKEGSADEHILPH